ncbi:MAG: zeta toxin family protein [Candidatus Binataceae bacterium]
MADEPWLWLLAGPNGAGKSTSSALLINLAGGIREIVNPDEIARRLLPGAPEKAAIQAGRLARQRFNDLLKERRSFAIETTLSGHLHLQDVKRAKSEGWNAGLLYVGLRSPHLAVDRVRQRTLRGGHDVPEEDIRRRYERSLVNLAAIYQIVDAVLVCDNSSSSFKIVLIANGGELTFKAPRLPRWASISLGKLIAAGPKPRDNQ